MRINVLNVEGVQLSDTHFEYYLDDVSKLSRFVLTNVALDGVRNGTALNVTVLGLPTDSDKFRLVRSALSYTFFDESRCTLPLTADDNRLVLINATTCRSVGGFSFD